MAGMTRMMKYRFSFTYGSNYIWSRPCIHPCKCYSNSAVHKSPQSPITANVLRLIHNEIENLVELTPPYQPWNSHELFMVNDKASEQWISLKKMSGKTEELDLEATMFDGMKTVHRNGNEDKLLHITLLVRISKKSYSENRPLEFICSAWPNRLEIHRVYFANRSEDLDATYSGRDFRKLRWEMQVQLRMLLEEKGVNGKLCSFLHYYMLNKDKIELLNWFQKLHAFLER